MAWEKLFLALGLGGVSVLTEAPYKLCGRVTLPILLMRICEYRNAGFGCGLTGIPH
jgi:hypothetical protein